MFFDLFTKGFNLFCYHKKAWAVVTSVVLILTILYNCVENEESPVIKFRDHEIDSLLPMSESGPKFSIKK